LVQRVLAFHAKHGFDFRKAAAWKAILLCVLVALVIARSEGRLEGNIRSLRARPTAAANPVLNMMKAQASRTKWVYSENGIYAFHERFLVPPEVAIIMPKRFWSGQITTAAIIEACQKYRVDMIILPTSSFSHDWQRFLRERYSLLAKDEKSSLYVENSAATAPHGELGQPHLSVSAKFGQP